MSIYHRVHALKRKVNRRTPKSPNFYLRATQEAYQLASEANPDNKLLKTIAKRLCLSRNNRPVMSLSAIAHELKDNKTAVVAATVTNDERNLEVKKMNIVAMKFTATARARIERAGGKCITFDEMLHQNPTEAGFQLMEGDRKARKQYEYFGAAGLPNSTTKVKGYMTGCKWARRDRQKFAELKQKEHQNIKKTGMPI